MPDKRIIFNHHEKHPQHMKNQTHGEPVGWCSNNKHRGKLSIRQMKNHKCLGKRCKFFTKNEKHSYWAQRERIKRLKKERKQREKEVLYETKEATKNTPPNNQENHLE